MFIPNLAETVKKINSSIPRRSVRTFQKIQEEFVNRFTESFMCCIESKGYENNQSVLDSCLEVIFEEEVEGILSNDNSISTSYYNEFNRQCAFAFYSRLDKKRLRYGGYSVKQIIHDIEKAADDLSNRKNQIYTNEQRYRLVPISKRICKKIGIIFAKDRNLQRSIHLRQIDYNRYEPLDPIQNYWHPDSLLRTNADIQRICHMPVKENAKYMSFPVVVGSHISDDILQKDNLIAISAPIAGGYGQAGGYTASIYAGPGTGKTFYIANDLAPLLGEICNCEVYITYPYRSQIAQARQIYDCDVCFSEEKVHETGYNPNIRAYVYDCVKDIPATSIDHGTGIARPNILVIDEAHSLVTERYRGKTLNEVIEKAKEILSAGGVVISMSASWEMIAGTIPYNSMTGYDLLCNIFRVSSKAPLNDNLKYPNYTYADAVKYGPEAGVEIVNAVPAKNIKVLYHTTGKDGMTITLATTIIKQLREGKRVIAEYNGIDVLTECGNMLEKLGYRTTVCSSNDKDFTLDKESGSVTYNNSVYNAIINEGCIDFGSVDVVLTTKLLENGTTIDRIKGDIDKYNISTIFVLDKRNQLNLEAFEQFSGRLRFKHEDAILLMPCPETGHRKIKPDMQNHLRKDMTRIQDLAELITGSMILKSRLHNIDFNGFEDLPEGLDEGGMINAYTISNAVYKAVNAYYKELMYDKEMFEQAVKERFSAKNVTFDHISPDSDEFKRACKAVSEEAAKEIRNNVCSTISDADIRDFFITGYNKNEPGSTPALLKTMKDFSKKNYIEPLSSTLSVVFALQDIAEETDALTDKYKNVPKPELDPSFKPESFRDMVTSAILHTNKRHLNSLLDMSLADGFKYLAKFKGLSEPVYRYALQYGDKDYDADELLQECRRLLPPMPKDLNEKVTALMENLFKSEKKKRIDRLIYTCKQIRTAGLGFYAHMSAYTSSEIDQITMAYEFSSYGLNPKIIHADDTASGATFEVITGAESYVAITGANGRTFKGLDDFCGKRITKERADIIYNIYKRNMKRNGFKYVSDIRTGRLKILRLFASIFTFRQEESDGEVYIVLEKLRKKRPNDYDQIIHLNFSNIVRNQAE